MNLIRFILITLCLFPANMLHSQDMPAYVIYTAKGKKTTFEKMTEASEHKELILFGEFHDNPITHWLQFELTKEMYAQVGAQLELGFEMFEQDQQAILDAYVTGKMDEKKYTMFIFIHNGRWHYGKMWLCLSGIKFLFW